MRVVWDKKTYNCYTYKMYTLHYYHYLCASCMGWEKTCHCYRYWKEDLLVYAPFTFTWILTLQTWHICYSENSTNTLTREKQTRLPHTRTFTYTRTHTHTRARTRTCLIILLRTWVVLRYRVDSAIGSVAEEHPHPSQKIYRYLLVTINW